MMFPAHLPAFYLCGIMEEKGVFAMLFFRKNVRYVTMNAAEARLAKYALLWFRNRLIAEGKPTEDVNGLLIKLMK